MDIHVSDDIKRLKDGTIDFNYYSSLGQQARNKEIKAVSGMILDISRKSMAVLPIFAILIVLNLVL